MYIPEAFLGANFDTNMSKGKRLFGMKRSDIKIKQRFDYLCHHYQFL